METLIKFKNFVDEMMLSNSRNYKIQILEKYKNDEDIKYYLNFIYNPYIITGISKKKINKDVNITFDYDEDWSFKDLLEYLKTHNTGRDEDLAKIIAFDCYHFVPESDKELYELFQNIITKDLQLGIDTLTINKGIPGLIPQFSVQLANKYFERPQVVEGKEFSLTTKIDGGRIIALKENGQVSFYTRSGQKYEGLVDLEQEMLEKLPDNLCLDGELTLLDKGKLTSKEQYKETMKISRKDGIKHGLKMLVFDCMTAEEFKAQKCDTPYVNRRANLTVVNMCKYFDLLPILYSGTDTSKITEWLNYNISHGEEGVMININDAPYFFKRTDTLLKVKKMLDMDLPILDFEEGTGKNVGKLGAIITEYKGFPLKVGSGFTDEQRIEIWNNKEDYRGMTMSVQYFEETTNQQGGIGLRFPVFLEVRLDK